MAISNTTEELESNSRRDDNKPVSNELYAQLVEAIKSLNRGDEVNALKAMLSISRALG
jgi:hypothetical protein